MFYPCALHQADLGWSKRLVEYVVAYIKGPKPGRNGSTKALEDMNDGLHRLSNLTPGLHPPTCFTLDPGKSSSANDADKVAKATGKEARVLSICLPYLAARYIPWPSIRENIIRVLVAFLDWSLLRETRNPSTEELDALDAAYKHLLEVYEEVFEEKPDFPKAHSGWHYRELLEDFGDVAVGSTNMFESGHKMMTGRSNYNASTYRRQAVLRALRIETMLLVQPPRPRMRHRTQPTAASGSFLTSVSILDLRNMDFGKLMRLNARERAASNLRLAVCAVPELQLVPLALIEFVHGELVRQGRDDPVAAAQSVLGATCNLAKGVKIEDECGIARASPFDTTPGARTRDAPAPTVGRTWDVEVEVDGVDRLARLVAVVEACSATQPVTTDAIAVVKLFADEDHQGELLPSEGGHGGALPGQRMAWATKWRHCTTRGRTLLHPDVRAVPVRNIVRTVLMHPLGPELDGADDGHLWPGAMLNDNFTQETFLENTYLELIHERL
ncbi:unnamed protein product [Pedinophyceae sp. YPF-701]|nr:unnamed protein product [Pedinophyceae sp. YPF-701]